LKSTYHLSPGVTLNLPIEVPEEKIVLNGKMAPKLKEISSSSGTGTFSVGDDIFINLVYYSEVVVVDNPTVILNTGCASSSCSTAEVQQFTCAATNGAFSLRLSGQSVMNVWTNTTREQFQTLLRKFHGMKIISVAITSSETDPSFRNTVCSPSGNTVTIYFNQTYFPEYEGDVPTIFLNRLNDDPNHRTRLSQGINEVFLTGFSLTDETLEQRNTNIYLPPNTTELVKGVNHTNGVAFYYNGNGTNRITFVYTIAPGDVVDSLDVVSINFQTGYLKGNFSNQNVSTEIPIFGIGPRYMTSGASSLSFNTQLQITSKIPSVINVNSPNVSDVYTAGDRLFIDVEFDLDISLDQPELITLSLASGIFSRLASFVELLDSRVIRFLYVVQELDSTPALDYVNVDSLALNDGLIYRFTTGRIINALTTLPVVGGPNSLASNVELIIDTTAPVAITVTTTSPVGNYTAGDYIDFVVTYNTKISVEGSPRFLLANTPRVLKAEIRTLPFLPEYSFERTTPNNNVQLLLELSFNWNLNEGDEIYFYLPRLFIRSLSPANFKRPTPLVISSEDFPENLLNSTWNDHTNELKVVISSTLARFTPIEFLIEGKSGLFVHPDGIKAPFVERIRVNSSEIDSIYTHSFLPHHVDSVGVSEFSLTFQDISFDTLLTMTLSVTTPELIERNDSFTLHLPQFQSALNYHTGELLAKVNDQIGFTNTSFYAIWNKQSSDLTLIYNGKQRIHSFSLNISNVVGFPFELPENGMNEYSILFSMNSLRNGNISRNFIPSLSLACSAPSDGRVLVRYLNQLPDANSDVLFKFSSGLMGLEEGDSVLFQLPYTMTGSSSSIGPIFKEYYSSSDLFSLQLHPVNNELIFTAVRTLNANQTFEILIDSIVGIKTPSTGVLSNFHWFNYQIQSISASCRMDSPRKIFYQYDQEENGNSMQIIAVKSGSIFVQPTTPAFNARVTGLGITIHFNSFYPNPLIFQPNDLIIITLPSLVKGNVNNSIDTANNTFVSNVGTGMYIAFNERVGQLECYFTASFQPSNHNDLLYINMSRSAQFFFPTEESMLLGHSFEMTMKSVNFGNLVSYPLTVGVPHFCMGFCLASLDYSTYLLNQPLTVSVNFSYQYSWTGSTPTLQLDLGSQIGLFGLGAEVITARLFSASTGAFISTLNTNLIYDSLNNVVAITLLSTFISNSELVSLEIGGFQFLSADPDNVIVLSISDTANYPTNPQVVKSTFPYPRRLHYSPVMKFANVSIFRNANDIEENQIAVSFELSPHYYLYDNNYILLNSLQFLGYSSSDGWTRVALNDERISSFIEVDILPVELGTINLEESYYDFPSRRLLLNLEKLANSTIQFSITLNTFQFQDINNLQNLTYQIGFYKVNNEPADDLKYLTAATAYSLIETVPTVLMNKIEFTERNTSDYSHILEMMITVSLSVPISSLEINSKLTIKTDFFSSRMNYAAGTINVIDVSDDVASNVMNPTVTYTVDLVAHKEFFEIDFPSTTLLVPENPNDLVLLMNVSTLDLFLSADQSRGNDQVTTIVYDANNDEITRSSSDMPCVGICSADLIPLLKNPGRASDYFLNFSFANTPNLRDLYLIMDLNHFTARPKNISLNIQCWDSLQAQPLVNSWSSEVIWRKNITQLEVVITNLTVGNDNIVHYVSCFIPNSYYLIQPANGVHPWNNQIPLKTRFVALTGPSHLHRTGTNYEFTNEVTVSNIGGRKDASLILSPMKANSKVSLNITLSFIDPLKVGDNVLIFLPGYTVPSLPIAYELISPSPLSLISYFQIQGIAANRTQATNLDQSLYYLNTMAYLNLTITHEIIGNATIHFNIPADADIISPQQGTYSTPPPIINVISLSSPIAGTSFKTMTKFSTLEPSTWQLGNITDSQGRLQVSFNLSCPFLTNDTIFVYLPNIRLPKSHPSGAPTRFPTSQPSGFPTSQPTAQPTSQPSAHFPTVYKYRFTLNGQLSSNYYWNIEIPANTPQILKLQLLQGSIFTSQTQATHISFSIDLVEVESLTTQVIYENDPSVYYYVESDLCPIPKTSFARTNAFHLHSSTLEYSLLSLPENVSLVNPDSANGIQKPIFYLQFDFQPNQNIVAVGGTHHNQTVLRLVLDNVVTFPQRCNGTSNDCVTIVNTQLATPSGLFTTAAHVRVSFNAILRTAQTVVDFLIDRRIYKGEKISLSTLPMLSFLNSTQFNSSIDVIGFQQYNLSSEDFASSLELFYANYSSGVSFTRTIVAEGMIEEVVIPLNIEVEGFVIKSPVAGRVSEVVITWQLSNDLTLDRSVVVALPGFSLSNPMQNSWTYVSDDLVQQFSVQWDASKETLQFTPLILVPAHLMTTIIIDEEKGLTTPVVGIPSPDTVYSMTVMNTISDQVLAVKEVSSMTPVPYLPDSSISFLSSTEPDSYAYNGMETSIQLAAGHELTTDDVGSQIIIDQGLYTITGLYQNNILTILEPYSGRRVVLGSPVLPIHAPPFRSAFYLNGTNSKKLFFHYLVRRGDKMNHLALYSASMPAAYSIDFFYGGSMLRFSDTPVIPISVGLPALSGSSGRVVNTDYPVVVEVSTTSPSGSYSEGQIIDIMVKFSYAVTLNIEEPAPVPRLSLFLSSGRTNASYVTGSQTNTLVFFYVVRDYDHDVGIAKRIIQEDDIFRQPLRIIQGTTLSTLRRSAYGEEPILDASLDLDNADFIFPVKFNIIAETAKIVEVKVVSRGVLSEFVYGAGEFIDIMVVFSQPIATINATTTVTGSSYILLDVGRSQPGVAGLNYQFNDRSLLYSYLVTTDDVFTHGLKLHCTCLDYLQRTFLHLNAPARIISWNVHQPASLILASSSSAEDLQIDSRIEINNQRPRVISLSTNVTDGVFGPGDKILISVKYSTPITIQGVVTLILRGQSTVCRAAYYDGNKTDTIQFLYSLSSQSGTGRLDCDSVDSLLLDVGTIYRVAFYPTLSSINALPIPGSGESLGRKATILIDPEDNSVTSVKLIDQNEEGKPYFASHQIDVNIPREEMDDLIPNFLLKYCNIEYSLQQNEIYTILQTYREYYKGIDTDILLRDATWGNYSTKRTNISINHKEYDYYSIYSSDLSFPLLYDLPYNQYNPIQKLISSCFNWWNNFYVTPYVEFYLNWNRNITVDGLIAKVNTKSNPAQVNHEERVLNSAFMANENKLYYLRILEPAYPTTDGYFIFRYNGRLSRCLTITIALSSYQYIQGALTDIADLQSFVPIVQMISANAKYTEYTIEFNRFLDYPLEILSGENQLQDLCPIPALAQNVSLYTHKDSIPLRYPIRAKNSLVMKLKETLPTGSFQLLFKNIPMNQNLTMKSKSFLFEHFDSRERLLGKTVIPHSASLPKVLKSEIIFGSVSSPFLAQVGSPALPGSNTTIQINLCLSLPWHMNDIIVIHLPDFNDSNSALTFASGSHNGNTLHWNSSSSSLVLKVLTTNLHNNCIDLYKLFNYHFHYISLPPTLIYENAQNFVFTILRQDPLNPSKELTLMAGIPFQRVSGVGFNSFKISFSDPRPNFPTDIRLSFELLQNIAAGSDTIVLYLPGFHAPDAAHTEMTVNFPHSQHLSAHWSNHTHLMTLTTLHPLLKGVYEIVLTSKVSPVLFPSIGLSLINPPTITLNSPSPFSWNCDPTVVQSYPVVFGFTKLFANVQLNNETNEIRKISISVAWSEEMQGPMQILIQLPFIIFPLDFYEETFQNMTLIAHADAQTSDELVYDRLKYHNENKTFILWKTSPFRTTNQMITFHISNLTGFSLNASYGIAGNHSLDKAFIAVYNAQGSLNFSPLPLLPVIPAIYDSSVQLVVMERDIFMTKIKNSYENILISFKTNIYLRALDYFGVQINNNYLTLDFSNAKIVNTVCFNLSSGTTNDGNLTTVFISATNESHSCHYHLMKSVVWNITNVKVVNDNLNHTHNIVRLHQFKNPNEIFALSWFNTHRPVEHHSFIRKPYHGLYSSRVVFDNPYRLERSNMTVELFVATSLNQGDVIRLSVPKLIVLYPANKRFLDIYDQHHRLWQFRYNDRSHEFTFVAPINFYAKNFIVFQIPVIDCPVIMPSEGISFNNLPFLVDKKIMNTFNLNSSLINAATHQFSVGFSRDANFIQKEIVTSVTPVGKIDSFHLELLKTSDKELFLSLDMLTLSSLLAYENIIVTFQNDFYSFPVDFVFPLAPEEALKYQIKAVKSNQLIITLWEKWTSPVISLQTLLTNKVRINEAGVNPNRWNCSETTTACDVKVEIKSVSNPVRNFFANIPSIHLLKTKTSVQFLTTYSVQDAFLLAANTFINTTVNNLVNHLELTFALNTLIPRGLSIALDISAALNVPVTTALPGHGWIITNRPNDWKVSRIYNSTSNHYSIQLEAVRSIQNDSLTFQEHKLQIYFNHSVWNHHNCLYSQTADIPFKIVSSRHNLTYDEGIIRNTVGLGLMNATIQFHRNRTQVTGRRYWKYSPALTAVNIHILPIDEFFNNELISIHLPGLIKTLPSPAVSIISHDAGGYTLSWDSSYKTVNITVGVSPITEINFDIVGASASTPGFSLPSTGMNQFQNTPMITYFHRNNNFDDLRQYGPVNLNGFKGIAPKIAMNVSFPRGLAGRESAIRLQFTALADIHFSEKDQIKLFLPQFRTDFQTFTVVSNQGDVKVEWIACDEVLVVTIEEDFVMQNAWELLISDFVLPMHGINSDLLEVVAVGAWSSNYEEVPIIFSSFMKIGKVYDSRLVIGSHKKIDTINDFMVEFKVNHDLYPGDDILITIPDANITSSSCVLSSNLTFSGIYYNQGVHIAQNHSQIRITSQRFIHQDRRIELNFSSCLILSRRGFPSKTFSLDDYTITINPQLVNDFFYGNYPIEIVTPVGLLYHNVYYSASDYQLSLQRIRLEFSFSNSLSKKDVITVHLPVVNTTKAVVSNIQVTSDFFGSSAAYETIFFIGSWDGHTQILTLVCQTTIPVRPFNVFIEGNEIEPFSFISQNNVVQTQGALIVHPEVNDYVHYMLSANISSIGYLSKQRSEHYPVDLSFVRNVDLNIKNCNQWNYCDLQVEFSSFHNLTKDSLLVFSHDSLGNDKFDANYNWIDFIYENMSIVGTEGEFFELIYREADNVQRNISLLPNSLQLASFHSLENHNQPTSFAYVDAIQPVKKLDLELNPLYYDLNLYLTLTTTRVARIVSMEVIDKSDSNNVLFYGDELFFALVFSLPVMVIDGGRAKILLNSKEFANYMSGNETDTLIFKYSAFNPFHVQTLAVDGPGALSIFSFDNIYGYSEVNDFDVIPANLTIPEPYTFMVADDSRGGAIGPVLVDYNMTANAVKVYTYSGEDRDYSNGDILDIAVVFDRPVVAVGKSFIEFVDSNSHASHSFIAENVNVSTVQRLSFDSFGYYQLVYRNQSSSCIPNDDLQQLYRALLTMAELEEALPVEIEVLSDPEYVYSYQFTFFGIAPSPFRIQSDYCSESPRAKGRAHLPSEMLNQIIFRYEVKNSSDVHGNVSYASQTFIQVANTSAQKNNIFVVNPLRKHAVNRLLPDPTGPNGLLRSLVRINNDAPFISRIYSNWSSAHPSRPYAINGETIDIVVQWSCPITVVNGDGNIFLSINVTNLVVERTQNESFNLFHTRNISFVRYEEDKMYFRYAVRMGDITFGYLDVTHLNQLHIRDDETRIVRKSRIPFTDGSLLLPTVVTPAARLTSSQIVINATHEPIITRVFTDDKNYNPLFVSDKKIISVTAGTTVDIFVEFSSHVTVIPHVYPVEHLKALSTEIGACYNATENSTSSCPTVTYSPPTRHIPPFVTFASPLNTLSYYKPNMTYVETINGNILRFLFTVEENFLPGNISFAFNLQYGHLMDELGHVFTNLTNANSLVTVFEVENLVVDTRVPKVVRVDCVNPNGTYYAGDELDVFLVWDKPVYILNSTPTLKLFVEAELSINSVAEYSYGNGTHELHFRYVVPAPNINHAPFSNLKLDYAASEALVFYLNGTTITDVSPHPRTLANVYLPIFHHSHLMYHRDVWIDVNYPEFVRVFSAENGTFSAGDTITVGVEFTSPVMVFNPPPFLLLNTSKERNALGVPAKYVRGNNTKVLYFHYQLKTTDNLATGIDYVDTRIPPYSTSEIERTFALIGYDDYYAGVLNSPFAGIFMSSKTKFIQMQTSLPPPGEIGSLSMNSQVSIDNEIPFIQKVTSTAPSGTYNWLTTLNISVTFSKPVVVIGCPRVLFVINKQIRPATFNRTDPYNGNGTTVLYFTLPIREGDLHFQLDYYDIYSFKLGTCESMNDPNYYSEFNYIRRLSPNPIIDANLTLPEKTGLITVVSPKSIFNSGKLLNLVGSASYPTIISKYSPPNLSHDSNNYFFGDVLRILVRYSGDITVRDSQTFLALNDFSKGRNLELSYASAVFSQQNNVTDIVFELVIPPYDTVDWLTYKGTFAIQSLTTECPFFDNYIHQCAAQNLPKNNVIPDYNYLKNSKNGLFTLQQDSLTPLQLSISSLLNYQVTVVGFEFVNWNLPTINAEHNHYNYLLNNNATFEYFTGQRIQVKVTFSADVLVTGQPRLELTYRNSPLYLIFEKQLNNQEILFSHIITEEMEGMVNCGLFCRIIVEDRDDSNIFRQSNSPSLGLIPVDLSLESRECEDLACVHQSASLTSLAPVVNRVYSNASDVLAWNDTVYIFVEFTTNVYTVGIPALILDIPPLYPTATYLGLFHTGNQSLVPPLTAANTLKEATDTLVFTYFIEKNDNTNSLDYFDIHSLYFPDPLGDGSVNPVPETFPDNSTIIDRIYSPGIYLISKDILIPADLTLPYKGAIGSLGRGSEVIIDQERPFIRNVYSDSSFVTCGDYFVLSVEYSQNVVLTKKNFFLAKQLGINESQIFVKLMLLPTKEIITATFLNIQENVVNFEYYISARIQIGQIVLLSDSVINLLNGNAFSLSSVLNGLNCPLFFRKSLVNKFSVPIIKAIPQVLQVYSPNITLLYPFTAGDILDIYLEYDLPVRIGDPVNTSLSLQLDNRIAKASFMEVVPNTGSRLLYFQFQLLDGDVTKSWG
jgi:hypothetical protein